MPKQEARDVVRDELPKTERAFPKTFHEEMSKEGPNIWRLLPEKDRVPS